MGGHAASAAFPLNKFAIGPKELLDIYRLMCYNVCENESLIFDKLIGFAEQSEDMRLRLTVTLFRKAFQCVITTN